MAAKLGRNQILALTVKAWNAYRQGKTDVKNICWGKKKEAFPKIV